MSELGPVLATILFVTVGGTGLILLTWLAACSTAFAAACRVVIVVVALRGTTPRERPSIIRSLAALHSHRPAPPRITSRLLASRPDDRRP